ncbi:D-serine ammonia-lyase [Vibrio sp. Isolate25]|uniref:D-serine ammonia-lyase n=1 Tax=Vibrio sp. Isolate25 TaxID=2908535 RepID=UPI001EFD782F|nr:D-serine ammonia-lyase [Vibrio sp. Isolate25]MCG9595827.1 D-serine ammonia-lyase [Vibrio sp. Isolate25]
MDDLLVQYPLINRLTQYEETSWFNPNITSTKEALPFVGLTQSDSLDASQRLQRFATYLAKVFPETAKTNGIIESPIYEIPAMKSQLEATYQTQIAGQLLMKMDSHLPISGSVKARGGIYEVLTHAEQLAMSHGLLRKDENYQILDTQPLRDFFSRFSIAVGSTGNLGLSIGIMSARLGFQVTVHMSSDAREWKKTKLREHGVTVREYDSDYGVAIEQGRLEAEQDPNCFFIDDENSKTLFLGYSVAGERVKKQFENMNIHVDEQHPLFVYLPCGVGGGPGGVAFGLKLAFGDHVHCIFAEPTHSPCMLLGVHTGLHDQISVQDIGLDNITAADGLAVGRASGFVGRAMERMIDGYYTVADDTLFAQLKLLKKTEGIELEPSALAGMKGPIIACKDREYLARLSLSESALENATHLVWATGGGMVPQHEMDKYLTE